MNWKNLIFEWRYVLTFFIAFAIYVLFEWQRAKTTLYALMLQAKRYAKDAVLKSGKEQEEWVVKKAFQFLPLSLRLFLSEDTIRKIVKWLFGKLKDYIDDGKLNGSIT